MPGASPAEARSKPAQKPRPEPLITSTLQRVSAPIASSSRPASATIASLSALSFAGRSSRRRLTPSASASSRTSGIDRLDHIRIFVADALAPHLHRGGDFAVVVVQFLGQQMELAHLLYLRHPRVDGIDLF